MNIIISDKKKKNLFISIFQMLKSSSLQINASFYIDYLHIQGMDISHICLFDLKLKKDWFDTYNIEDTINICFETNTFYSMINNKNEEQILVIKREKEKEDSLLIQFINGINKSDYEKYFVLPLFEYDYEKMNITETDYNAEFSLSAKKITDILECFSKFGDEIIIKCNEQEINLKTYSSSGEMGSKILFEDLSSYSIIEGEELLLTYSLTYINKMCITNKLSNDIYFCLSKNFPMKIQYDLGNDNFLMFYIAPKLII